MKTEAKQFFFSGTSGLLLPIPQYLFPPPYEKASRLSYYGSLLNSIEINSSFYRIPLPATVARWAGSVPPDFRFTFKLWKEITHTRGFEFNPEDIQRFFVTINSAEGRQGALLIQFPPSVSASQLWKLEKLLVTVREYNVLKWDVAVEFRNPSWYTEETYAMLNRFQTAMVIHDMPKSAAPLFEQESETRYVRFHGPAGDYRGGYSGDFLSEFATLVRAWIKAKKRVYMYFNNTVGEAWDNLATLNELVYKT